LEQVVLIPEPLLAPFTDKGKQVSFIVSSGLILETENQKRWSPGPMGTGCVISASNTPHTASGLQKVSIINPAAQKIV